MNRLEINHTPPPCGKPAGRRTKNQITMTERINKEEYLAIYDFLREERCPFEITRPDSNEFYGDLLPKGKLIVFKNESDLEFPGAIEVIQRIRRLDLSALTTEHLPFSFRPFFNLEELSFDGSGFRTIPIGFNALPKLKYLNLSRLNLWDFPKLDGLKNLEVLALRGVKARDFFFDDMFSGLTKLRVLDLQFGRLDNFSFFKSLKGLKHLEYVDLRGADLSKVDKTNSLPDLDCEILTGLNFL